VSTKTSGGVRLDSGGCPRDWLISALGVSVGDDQARRVVDALDVYLDEPDRGVRVLDDLTPDYRGELDKVRAERDAAVELTKETLRSLQAALERLQARDP
jgi:hypothetical protein